MEEFYAQLDALFQAGDLEKIEAFLKQNLSLRSGAEKVAVLNELAGFYRGISRYDESVQNFQEALTLLEQAGQKNSNAYATVLLNLAGVYRLTRKLDLAAQMFEHALTLLDPEDYAYASAKNNLSLVRLEQGDPSRAAALAGEALEWMRGHGAPEHEVATALVNLANICLRQKDVERADVLLKEALALYDKMEEVNVHHAAALSAQGMVHYLREEWDEAEDAFRRALKLTEHFFGHNAEYKATLRNLELTRQARELAP